MIALNRFRIVFSFHLTSGAEELVPVKTNHFLCIILELTRKNTEGDGIFRQGAATSVIT
jgi:hypothetical protein